MRTPAARQWQGPLLGLAAGLLLWGLGALGLVEGLENQTWDWRVRALARPAASTAQVKLIAVDQDSLDWAQKVNGLTWPWPRQVYAPIIEFCRRAGAKAVALDILFSEPSPLAGDDEELAAVLARGGVVGAAMLARHTGAARAWPPELKAKTLDPAGLGAWPQGEGRALGMPRALLPTPVLAQGFAWLGNVGEDPDHHQVIRRITPLRFFDGRGLASLGLMAYCAGAPTPGVAQRPPTRAARTGQDDDPTRPVMATGAPGWLRLGDKSVPLDQEGRAILRFRGRPGSHQKFSAAAVIQSELALQQGGTPTLEPGVLKDCYVLVGLTAPGLHDLRASPLASLHPGTELHATALDNLLAQDFIRPAPAWGLAASLLLMGLFSGLVGVLAVKPWQGSLCLLLLTPLPLGLGFLLYQAGWWWPVAAPALTAALALVATMVLNYASEGRQRRFIKRAFRHYLSPQVIEAILADPSKLSLGGQRRELTIFFSDLQGFTSLSEGLDPQELAGLLNDYLSDMTDIILQEGGTLDKYEGDAIVAFWNAPLDQPDHALRACRAALGCLKRLEERQAHYQARAGRPLFMRTGLNSGPVVVGNLGSRTRFDYTVLGDAANLASRLEGANKLLGTALMVSEATWRQTGGVLPARELGDLRVVGRAAPVRVYEPFDPGDRERAARAAAFHEALALLRQRRWAEAQAHFAALAPDSAAAVYAARCQEMLDNPDLDWDGVWNLSQK
ncbi:MAG: adenylate/guanylate cyclase domain-containing protein [Desulfarculus sp.]|nr:adenylate/guanylate cyclase domain-containing protein [Desulfarculus sp.]